MLLSTDPCCVENFETPQTRSLFVFMVFPMGSGMLVGLLTRFLRTILNLHWESTLQGMEWKRKTGWPLLLCILIHGC